MSVPPSANLGQDSREGVVPDARWHLASLPREVAATELEFSLFRVFSAFDRWQVECIATVLNERLTSTEGAVLNVIRLKERAKSPVEIARLLNRDDTANINYAMRKLLSLKLIERSTNDTKTKGSAYQVTKRGTTVTSAYAAVRKQVLLGKIPNIDHWDEKVATACQVLDQMRSTYEQASLFLATHRKPFLSDETSQNGAEEPLE